MEFAGKRVVMIFENPYIYDGWSAALTEDGELHNRWPEDDHRHAATDIFISELKDQL